MTLPHPPHLAKAGRVPATGFLGGPMPPLSARPYALIGLYFGTSVFKRNHATRYATAQQQKTIM